MLNFKPTTQSSVFTRPQPTGSRNEPRPPSRQASERTPTTSADGQRNEPQPPSRRTAGATSGRRAAGRLNCAQPRTPEAVTRLPSHRSGSLYHWPRLARRKTTSPSVCSRENHRHSLHRFWFTGEYTLDIVNCKHGNRGESAPRRSTTATTAVGNHCTCGNSFRAAGDIPRGRRRAAGRRRRRTGVWRLQSA